MVDEECDEQRTRRMIKRRMLGAGNGLNRERKGDKSRREGIHSSEKWKNKESVIAKMQKNMDRNDVRKFYVNVNDVRHKPAPAMGNGQKKFVDSQRGRPLSAVSTPMVPHRTNILSDSDEQKLFLPI